MRASEKLGKTGVAALVVVFACAPLALVLWGGALQHEPRMAQAPHASERSAQVVFEDAPSRAHDGATGRYAIEQETPEWIDTHAREPTESDVAAATAVAQQLLIGSSGGDGALHDVLAAGCVTGSSADVLAQESGPRGSVGYGGLSAPRAALPSSGVIASTFVGGHGTASRLEDLMDRGVVVDGHRVQLGAFDALGPLPYPVPSEHAVALYAELERSVLREDGEHVHMQIALVARNGERPARPRIDVRLVIDRSGSMQYGDKWSSTIAAAHALVDHLRPSDTFGLVSYSDTATLDVAPARVGDGRAAQTAISRLRPGGGTHTSDALDVVAANAPVRRAPTDVLLVVLISDGMATIGSTDADSLAARSRAMFERSGTITTTLGVGTDFDESSMLAIAREGSGSYEFVRRAADIAPILTQELDERALAVAQDLRLRIELSPGVTLERIYGSRVLDDAEAARVRATEVAVDERIAHELGIARDRQLDDQTGLRMHIPSFRRGDQHAVLLELVVPPGTGDTEIAQVSLDYKDLAAVTNEHDRVLVHGERTADLERADQSVRHQVKRTVLAFQAAETLREASEALAMGDVRHADTLLDERVTLLRTAARVWHDDSMQRDAHLLASYQRAIGGAWDDWDTSSRHTLVLAMGYYGDQRME